jgi:hypothetical protein
MSDETRKLVFEEIPEDISKLAPKDIQRHLEQHG